MTVVRALVTLAVFLLTCARATAFAQTAKPVAGSIAVEMPALVTDRPDFTESSEVVGHRTVQIETGFTLESDRAGGMRVHSITTPAVLARIGVGSRFELRLGGDGFLHAWTPSDGKGGASGHSDIELGAKLKILGIEALDLAVIPIVSIPTHDDDYSSGTVDPTVKLTWATTLPRDVGLSGNINVARPSDPQGRFTQQAVSVSLAHDLLGGWGGYWEAYTFTPMERGLGSGWTLNTGVTRSLGADMQLDVEVGRGVTSAAPDWFVGFGFVVRSRPRPMP
jgi:hypothetical protein